MRTTAALLLAAGLVLAGWLGWQVWGTGLATARAQQDAARELTVRWAGGGAAAVTGAPVARLRIPRLDASWTVLEGVDEGTLARGPGHYPGTARPGERGTVAIAGHRVTHGAPFEDLDELGGCDLIHLDVADATWTYRVLPTGDGGHCPARAGLPGREVVTPDRDDVLAPVPGRALLTLTTCHPRYSARERLVVRAELVDDVDTRAAAAATEGA